MSEDFDFESADDELEMDAWANADGPAERDYLILRSAAREPFPLGYHGPEWDWQVEHRQESVTADAILKLVELGYLVILWHEDPNEHSSSRKRLPQFAVITAQGNAYLAELESERS